MALTPEIWIKDIQENLYENNEFVKNCVSHDEYVQNRTVHVPIAGSDPEIVKDRTQLPATISTRQDEELEYTINNFSTNPITVSDLEAFQLSYPKRQSVAKQHFNALTQRCMRELLIKWSATLSGHIVRTSGADSNDTLAPGATGTRKIVTAADIRKLARVMDDESIPDSGRVLVMTPGMYYQLFADADFKSSFVMGQPTVPNGKIGNAYGFSLYTRPTVAVYDNAGTPAPKAFGAATATSDNLSCLAFHPEYVAKAEGQIKVFLEQGKADYYGDVMSALIFFGGTKLRSTELGVVQLVQAA